MDRLSQDIIREAKVSPAPNVPLTQAGIGLVQWVLIMISAFIVVVIVGYGFKEYQSIKLIEVCHKELRSDRIEEAKSVRIKELIDKIREDQIEFRNFLKEIVQLILLNTFLPVLMALLGYIFGARQT